MKSHHLIINDEGRVCTPVMELPDYGELECDFEKYPLPICFDPREELKQLNIRAMQIREFVEEETQKFLTTKVELSDEWQEWGKESMWNKHPESDFYGKGIENFRQSCYQFKKNIPFQVPGFEFDLKKNGCDVMYDCRKDDCEQYSLCMHPKQVAVIKPLTTQK